MKRAAIAMGAVLVLVAGINGSVDLVRVVREWDSLRPVSAGTEVPQFRLSALDGGEFSSSDLASKTTIMTFWASWCGVCRSEMPMYEKLHRQFADDDTVQIVLVNREGNVPAAEGLAIAQRIRDNSNMTAPMVVDDDGLYRRLKAQVLPHTIVIDHAGIVRHVHEGRVMQSTLTDEIEQLRKR